MPLSSSQLAALVDRAKAKAPPPVPTPPPRPRQAVPAAPRARSPAPPTIRPVPHPPQPVPPSPPLPAKTAEPAAAKPAVEPDDFPIGWQLNKESWHFHRKFYRKFHRPMRQGEYSSLLCQVCGAEPSTLARTTGASPCRTTHKTRHHRHALAPDHHPAEGLAATPGAGGRAGGTERSTCTALISMCRTEVTDSVNSQAQEAAYHHAVSGPR